MIPPQNERNNFIVDIVDFVETAAAPPPLSAALN
jgi:hypothetical protein